MNWKCAVACYLIFILVCGVVICWDTDEDHQEPM